MSADMRFIVAQIGARRGYAVPAILDGAGLLERFYTDVCGDLGWGRQLARARFLPGFRAPLSRLAGRRLPAAIRRRTRTFGWPVCHHAWRGFSHETVSELRRSALVTLRRQTLRDGCGSADAIALRPFRSGSQ